MGVSMETGNKTSPDKYDCIVIGTGPAGYVSSIKAAQLGLKVVVVQDGIDMLGGACMDEGVIPAKSLIHSASILKAIRNNVELFGLEVQSDKVNLAKMVEKSRNIIVQLRRGLTGLFKKNGIDIINGHAQFLDRSSLRITGNNNDVSFVQADNILIATGSTPKPLPDIPFDGSNVISSFHALRLTEAPKKLIIVGGGAIGAEFASFFNIIGSEVSIVEFEDSLLPSEDADVSKGLQRLFNKEGINTYTSSKVVRVLPGDNYLKVTIQGENAETIQDCDKVLVSTGRIPLTSSLGLENAGVKVDNRGFIPVDNGMRTNIENIYAAGDVIPTPMLANVAFIEGEIAAKSVAGQASEPIDYDSVPNVVYTGVQVASIGLTEEQVIARGMNYSVGKQPFVGTFKSSITSEREGFIKVIAENNTGKLLGAHILAVEAAELIQGFVIAKTAGLTVRDIEKIIPPNPTFSETVVDASKSVFGKTVRA
jgi:dihydrolipoamide dehydrogenase